MAVKPAGRPPGLERDDHVYIRHPERGPIAVKVLAAGRDGFTGLCDRGERHGVPYGDVLGHKERVGAAYQVVDEGADGAIVQDGKGRRRYVEHGGKPGTAEAEPPGTAGAAAAAPPAPSPDDPLLGRMDRLKKATAMTDIPPNARLLLLKAGALANRPGLTLKDVTDRTGKHTKHWVRTMKDQPKGRPAGQADQAGTGAPMKHGDVVQFRHGDVEGKGRIVGSGADGVTVHDGQREHQVRHEHLVGKAPDAEQAGPLTPPIAAGDAGTAKATENPPPLFDAAQTAALPDKADQPVKDEAELYAKSTEALSHLQDWLDKGKGIADQLGFQTMAKGMEGVDWNKPGGMLFIAPLKGKARAAEKVASDYGGDWSKLRDVVRCSLAVDTMDQVKSTLAALQAGGMKLAMKPKDRFNKPVPVGYRDLLLNVTMPNGIVSEVQLHVKAMLQAKEEGHHHYEVERVLDSKAQQHGADSLSPEEQGQMRDAQDQQKAIYGRAWQTAMGSSGTGPGAMPMGGGEKMTGGEPMTKALPPPAAAAPEGAEGKMSYFDHEGAQFRRADNGVTRGVDDVLNNGKWQPYKGTDHLLPALFGDEIPDPLAKADGPAAGGEQVDGAPPAAPDAPPMRKALLFLKASIPGGAARDLLPSSGAVHGYMRGGRMVAGYTAARRKRAAATALVGTSGAGLPDAYRPAQMPHNGTTLRFPDHAHAALFQAGRDASAGRDVTSEQRAALWGHFSGQVEHDPDAGAPFAEPAHVDDLARDYHAGVVADLGENPPAAFNAGSVVDPDQLGDYLRRGLDGRTGTMAKAFPPADDLEKAGGKRSLYTHRKVTNGEDIAKHYRDQGCTQLVDPADMHTTVCYSKEPCDWSAMGDAPSSVHVPPSEERSTGALGKDGAVVLHYQSDHLQDRHKAMRAAGASSDYPTYKPHVTVSYDGKGYDKAKPWTGPIHLGPEVKAEIKGSYKPPTLAKSIWGFFKAAIAGHQQADLFAVPVTVHGYTRGKEAVHAYTAVRHKHAAEGAAAAVPEPAQDNRARRLAALQNRPTRYEAVLHHPDGRKHLVGYVTDKSGRGLRSALQDRAKHVAGKVGGGDDLQATPEGKDKIRLHSPAGEQLGHVTWSGRTQRDAIMSGEHPYVGDADEPAAASVALGSPMPTTQMDGLVPHVPQQDALPPAEAESPAGPDWRDETDWHARTMARMKTLPDESLRYIAKDAADASRAADTFGGRRAGKHADEAHYANMELATRAKAAPRMIVRKPAFSQTPPGPATPERQAATAAWVARTPGTEVAMPGSGGPVRGDAALDRHVEQLRSFHKPDSPQLQQAIAYRDEMAGKPEAQGMSVADITAALRQRAAVPPVAEPAASSADHKHFYVSAIDGSKRHLVAGPYGSHDEALGMVSHVKRHADSDPRAHFMGWGTAGSAAPLATPLGPNWKPDGVHEA